MEVLQDAAKAFLAADHFERWNIIRWVWLAGQRNVADALVRENLRGQARQAR